MHWYVKKFNTLSVDELYGLLHLRNEVFIVEQNCVYLDIDFMDQKSFHIFLEDNGRIVACARLIPAGVKLENISIGRVIVSPDYRRQGFAKELLTRSLASIDELIGTGDIELHGQAYLVDFYESFGFECIGDSFLEDGIPHFRMIKKL